MNLDFEDIQETITSIFQLFNEKGSQDYIGENITIYQHMVRCAYIAFSKGYNDEIIIASLLHDIGHLLDSDESKSMNGFGNENHELIGAQYLKSKGFSKLVVDIVAYHVAAKRYLCTVDKYYYDVLSDASKETLKLQGGKMSLIEVQIFENLLNYKAILLVRRIDDLAKDHSSQSHPIEFYGKILELHLFNYHR